MKATTLAVPVLLVAMTFAIVPAQAHVSYDSVEKITGEVVGDHRLNGLALTPDAVTFTWTKTQTYDCQTGTAMGRPTITLVFGGSHIEGQGGIYSFLGLAHFGTSSAGAYGMGAAVPVAFAVEGEGALGHHSYSGSGIGSHTYNANNGRLCAPPAEDVDMFEIDCGDLKTSAKLNAAAIVQRLLCGSNQDTA